METAENNPLFALADNIVKKERALDRLRSSLLRPGFLDLGDWALDDRWPLKGRGTRSYWASI
jgi:hypothetical protein